ncbi:MAG: hypothetical protein M3Q56_09175 [Bacteroidota bacterium]|nr:hypothetical protein [Bacteroidota bacterium]
MIFVLKINANGAVNWINYFGNNFNYFVSGINVNDEGSIAITGVENFFSYSETAFFLLVSKVGTLIKFQNIKFTDRELYALYNIEPTKDNQFIAVGHAGNSSTRTDNIVPLWYIKFNSQGDFVWNKTIIPLENKVDRGSFGSTITKGVNDDYYLVGRYSADRGA